MKELDSVRLTTQFENLEKGTEGAIVHVYPGGKDFEVEFFDTDGNTIDVLTTPRDVLELLSSVK